MPACHAGGRQFEPDLGRQYGGCRQVVKPPGCGSGIRGFESHHPPHIEGIESLGYRQAVRQRILIPSFAGSNPATLAKVNIMAK